MDIIADASLSDQGPYMHCSAHDHVRLNIVVWVHLLLLVIALAVKERRSVYVFCHRDRVFNTCCGGP